MVMYAGSDYRRKKSQPALAGCVSISTMIIQSPHASKKKTKQNKHFISYIYIFEQVNKLIVKIK